MITFIQGESYLIDGVKLTFVETITHGELAAFKKEDGEKVIMKVEELFDVEIDENKSITDGQ